jgi:MFS family permease
VSSPPSAQTAYGGRSALYAWFVVVVLALANCVSFIDRLILSLLVQPIKRDLGLSDTQVALVGGLAFALFYSLFGLVIARWADRSSRKWIVTSGITLWCFMTALCGMARNFGQLFMARVGVGVGEATLSPSAYSLIASYFPKERLSLAVGVFSAGVTGGTGFAFLLGGAAIAWVAALGAVDVPLYGALEGWRLVFAIVGLAGLPIALLMALIAEPPRASGYAPARLSEVWAHFRAERARYLAVFIGYGTTSITAFAVMQWTPAFYIRHYGASVTQAAYTLGTTALIGGLLGAFSGGALADYWERRGDPHAKLRVLFYCGIGLLLPPIVAPHMPTMLSSAAVIFFTFFFGTAATGPAGAYVQSITPDRMRAQFGAAYQLSLVLVGATLGPFLVALFTDYLFQDESKVGWSLSLTSAIANPIALAVLWWAYRSARTRQ